MVHSSACRLVSLFRFQVGRCRNIYGPQPNPKRPSARLASFAFLFFPAFFFSLSLAFVHVSVYQYPSSSASGTRPLICIQHYMVLPKCMSVQSIISIPDQSVWNIYDPPPNPSLPSARLLSSPDAGPPHALCPGHHRPCQGSVPERAQNFVGVQHRVPKKTQDRTGAVIWWPDMS